ncbi:MAG: FHA domain-containing protein [Eubacterium sp.]|nr:FHA domain-containing protein [Eubacterium sp.]
MRTFSFIAKNIGAERYLTYTMGEGMELDEDVLDYCEENAIDEIVNIIYQEDDDFDYLTYDVSGKMTLEKFTESVVNKEKVFKLLRNVAINMINIKEHAIPLSYILLNKNFMYIDPDSLALKFLYLPVESDGSVAMEFKSFTRQLLATMRYNVDEDLSYVGQLLTYVNGENFNLRGLINLTEALMKDAGIDYLTEGQISTDDGAEVVSNVELAGEKTEGATDFIKDLQDAKDLPEIGDDEDEDEIEVQEEPVKKPVLKEVEPASARKKAAASADKEKKETAKTEKSAESLDDIKAKIEEIVGNEDKVAQSENKPKPVKVSKAAMLKAAAESIEEEEAEEAAKEAAKNHDEKKDDKGDEEKNEGGGLLGAVTGAVSNVADKIGNNTIKINPYLIRNETEEKVIIAKPVFKIGKASRGVDFHVGGNGAISRQHAIILHKGDDYFLKDNKSTNHTYLDGKQLEPDEEAQLKDNSIIRLGDEDFTFKMG